MLYLRKIFQNRTGEQVKFSWDNFQIPKPFSTLTLVIGEPLEIPPDLDEEGMKIQCGRVRDALMAITED